MAQKGEHRALIKAYHEALGYNPMSWPQEHAGAKRILDAGYTIDQAITLYREMKSDRFWRNKHLSLQSVAKQLPAWVAAHEKHDDNDLEKWFQENN